MNRALTLSISKCYAIATLAVGCASQSAQGPEPQQHTVRQTTQTAPAELQLLCANEAAKAFRLAPDRVRPVGSSAQGMVYSVVLDAGGSQANCTLDQKGTILSLDRARTAMPGAR